MKVDHNKIQLGSDPDPTKNFVIQTPPVQDGTLEIRRGTLNAPGALVATFNEHGLVDPRVLVNATSNRTAGSTYTNNTSMPIDLMVHGNIATSAFGALTVSLTGGHSAIGYAEGNSAGGSVAVHITVPPGYGYILGGTNVTINKVLEYRIPEGA